MPLVIPLGNIHLSFQFRHDADPDPWYATFGVAIPNDETRYDMYGRRAITAMFAGVSSQLSNEVELTGVEMTIGQGEADPLRRFVPPLIPLRGESSSPKLPQNCALLVKKETDLGGRRNQGRFFLPAMLSEDKVSNTGVIDSVYRAALQSSITDIMVLLEDETSEAISMGMVILHGSEGAGDTTPTAVTSLVVDQLISTQRRRLR